MHILQKQMKMIKMTSFIIILSSLVFGTVLGQDGKFSGGESVSSASSSSASTSSDGGGISSRSFDSGSSDSGSSSNSFSSDFGSSSDSGSSGGSSGPGLFGLIAALLGGGRPAPPAPRFNPRGRAQARVGSRGARYTYQRRFRQYQRQRPQQRQRPRRFQSQPQLFVRRRL
ncbi:sericin 1 [Eurytemora carolleeae]|uniref:sericin 1 n=1 Tax=Eurytemora carolleeae TaxID=1294199 RepID=UPI000C782020|nr:sericin 1 [Eurytemora carolleeae]|eukprot:XP_023326309.1 sericin 1-like [Eurytemora affinis]